MKVIGLITTAKEFPEMGLFDWLAAVFEVRFELRQPNQLNGLDAAVVIASESVLGENILNSGLPLLSMLERNETPEAKISAPVKFAATDAVPKIFHGRTLE